MMSRIAGNGRGYIVLRDGRRVAIAQTGASCSFDLKSAAGHVAVAQAFGALCMSLSPEGSR